MPADELRTAIDSCSTLADLFALRRSIEHWKQDPSYSSLVAHWERRREALETAARAGSANAYSHPIPEGRDLVSRVPQILVVEDEHAVRRLAQRALEIAGYTVHAAASGREGLSLATQLEGALDLVITDLMMPDMGGRALAKALAPRFPALRVLYMSGYMPDTVRGESMLDPSDLFLEKPFTPAALVDTVRQILKRAS